jgi:hypothetical protein
MKGILKFDLEDHHDRMEFARCNASLEMALALWEIEQITRSIDDMLDHGEEQGISTGATIEMFKIKIFDALSKLNLDNLIE